jgi:glycosyltransferase involved in cell wall biosynthesis
MKILHLTSHLNIGGITTHVLNLSEALVARGHQVVVASGGGMAERRLQAAGIPHWRVSLNTSAEFSPQVAWATWQLRRLLRAQPVDVIHAHTRVAQVVAHGLSRRHGIPYVATWHGFYRHRRLGRRWLPCLGDLTIAISEEVREHVRRDFSQPEDRIRLIHHGIKIAHFAEAPDAAALQAYRKRWPADQRLTIGTVGRLASGGVKGVDLVLAAAGMLRSDMPNLGVLIVGDGPRRGFLEGEAKRLGIHERVHFLGATDDVRVPLALMGVFAFASRWPEAFGLSLVEAMAVGRPVVATRTGAAPEIITHGRDGWLVPPNDPAALAEGIRRLLTDPVAAAQLGRQAQARVREAFALDRMVSQVEAVYEELVAH